GALSVGALLFGPGLKEGIDIGQGFVQRTGALVNCRPPPLQVNFRFLQLKGVELRNNLRRVVVVQRGLGVLNTLLILSHSAIAALKSNPEKAVVFVEDGSGLKAVAKNLRLQRDGNGGCPVVQQRLVRRIVLMALENSAGRRPVAQPN